MVVIDSRFRFCPAPPPLLLPTHDLQDAATAGNPAPLLADVKGQMVTSVSPEPTDAAGGSVALSASWLPQETLIVTGGDEVRVWSATHASANAGGGGGGSLKRTDSAKVCAPSGTPLRAVSLAHSADVDVLVVVDSDGGLSWWDNETLVQVARWSWPDGTTECTAAALLPAPSAAASGGQAQTPTAPRVVVTTRVPGRRTLEARAEAAVKAAAVQAAGGNASSNPFDDDANDPAAAAPTAVEFNPFDTDAVVPPAGASSDGEAASKEVPKENDVVGVAVLELGLPEPTVIFRRSLALDEGGAPSDLPNDLAGLCAPPGVTDRVYLALARQLTENVEDEAGGELTKTGWSMELAMCTEAALPQRVRALVNAKDFDKALDLTQNATTGDGFGVGAGGSGAMGPDHVVLCALRDAVTQVIGAADAGSSTADSITASASLGEEVKRRLEQIVTPAAVAQAANGILQARLPTSGLVRTVLDAVGAVVQRQMHQLASIGQAPNEANAAVGTDGSASIVYQTLEALLERIGDAQWRLTTLDILFADAEEEAANGTHATNGSAPSLLGSDFRAAWDVVRTSEPAELVQTALRRGMVEAAILIWRRHLHFREPSASFARTSSTALRNSMASGAGGLSAGGGSTAQRPSWAFSKGRDLFGGGRVGTHHHTITPVAPT